MLRRRHHFRFLDLAAARLDEPLEPADEERLNAHLATCARCRERVEGYETDRAALRGLRQLPPPPRDLWARTASALDREQARAARRRSPLDWLAGASPGRRSARAAFAAALTFMVALAVLGSGLVPGIPGPFGPGGGRPGATPFAVEPQVFAWVSTRGGDVGVYVRQVDRVCPETVAAGCLPFDTDVRKVTSFADDFVPQQFAVAPDGRSGAVAGRSDRGGALYAFRFPESLAATPGPSIGTSPEAPATATATVSSEPVMSGSPGVETTPSPEVSPSPEIPPTRSVEPAPILENVILAGEAPAYSADGTLLAFSARPDDGTTGPDIYLWRVGSETAIPLTSDHASYFASWAGGSIVGSRASASADTTGESATPESFLLDLVTLEVRTLAHPGWRPVVDPTGRFVIFWDGTLAPNGPSWHEETGGLYLARWDLFDPSAVESTPRTEAPPESETTPGGSPEASLKPSGAQKLDPGRDYLRDPIVAWEVRWSPDGRWFGAWVGDGTPGAVPPSQPESGTLTVASVDPTDGRIQRSRMELDHEPALRGFALGNDRIAWATLPGRDGSSVVRLLVWNDRGRGVLYTQPGDGNDTLPGL